MLFSNSVSYIFCYSINQSVNQSINQSINRKGSITHITNASGTIVQELSYDAWGRMRNITTQIPVNQGSEPETFLGRGYTGHDHLPWFGLINMNARLYDPAVGRFLSPDPIIQDPTNTQNLNRYSYCLNNPLKYNDPTGMGSNDPFDCRKPRNNFFGKLWNTIMNRFRLAYGPSTDDGWGVNGSHDRWDGFGGGWDTGPDGRTGNSFMGHNGGFGGGGGGGGKKVKEKDNVNDFTYSNGVGGAPRPRIRGLDYNVDFNYGFGGGGGGGTDYRANLITSENPIGDIFRAIHHVHSTGKNVKNLFDVIVNNDYNNTDLWGKGWYQKDFNKGGYIFNIYVQNSNLTSKNKTDVNEYDFGILDRINFSKNAPGKEYYHDHGFYMFGDDWNMLIRISAPSKNALIYLNKYYHSLKSKK